MDLRNGPKIVAPSQPKVFLNSAGRLYVKFCIFSLHYRLERMEFDGFHRGVKSASITLHYLTLPYLTLPYVTLRYLTLRYLTLPYDTLRYLTLRYVTLP